MFLRKFNLICLNGVAIYCISAVSCFSSFHLVIQCNFLKREKVNHFRELFIILSSCTMSHRFNGHIKVMPKLYS
jgi:hypothetical protein